MLPLYLQWQLTFRTLYIAIKVMQVCDPAANLYICQMGSQPAENLLCISRTLNHNRKIDLLQLRDHLQAILDIQDIFQAHPGWPKRHEHYATDCLTPLQYMGDCSLQSVDLKNVWERGTARATAILEPPPVHFSPHGVFLTHGVIGAP